MINNINIDGNVFPLNQAKLVAEAIYNESEDRYEFNFKLKKGLYLVEITYKGISNTFTVLLSQNNYGKSLSFPEYDVNDFLRNFSITYDYDGEYSCFGVTSVDLDEERIFDYENMVLKFYELPITLGGNENE